MDTMKRVILCLLLLGSILVTGTVSRAEGKKPAVWDEKCAGLPAETERAEILIDGSYGCRGRIGYTLRIVQDPNRISFSVSHHPTPLTGEISPEEFRKYWAILRTQPMPDMDMIETGAFSGKITVTVFTGNASETITTEGLIPLPPFGRRVP